MPSLVTTGVAALYALSFVLPMLWLSAAIGRRVLRWLGALRGANELERGTVALTIGVGLLQYIPFGLGLAGALSVTSLRIAMAVVALAAVPDLLAVAASARNFVRHTRPPSRWLVVWAATFLPALLVLALLAMTPTLDADGLSYHLTVPKRWLSLGSLEYLPTYFASNTPMGVEMLFAVGLVAAGDAAAKLLHFALGIVGAIGLFLTGTRLRGKLTGAIAVVLYLVGPASVGAMLGWAYLEGAAALGMIASMLAWLIWFQERDVAWLKVAALLGGISVSFKITSALFPVGLVACTLLVLWTEVRATSRPLERLTRAVLPLVPLLALPVLPWLVRSWALTGNPVYPLFAGSIPTRDYSAEVAARLDVYNRYLGWAINFGADWSLGQRKAILLAIALSLVLAVVVYCVRRPSFLARGFALTWLVVTLAQLSAVGLYVRYWAPLLAVLLLPVIAMFESMLSARWVRSALIGATALASLVHARQSLRTVDGDLSGLLRTAFGFESQRNFLIRHLPLMPAYEQANRELPADSRIMLSGFCGGFYIDRTTYCSEFVQDSLRLTSWRGLIDDLLHLRVTHVLAPRAFVDGSPAQISGSSIILMRFGEYERVGRLLERYGRLIGNAADQGLYTLDTAALAKDPDRFKPEALARAP